MRPGRKELSSIGREIIIVVKYNLLNALKRRKKKTVNISFIHVYYPVYVGL